MLGIDYGTKRIGIARSDPMGMIASPIKTIEALKTAQATVDLIVAELDGVVKIVVGLPLLFSGKDSESTTKVRAFSKVLEERSGLPVILWDERLTTSQVEKLMKEDKVSRKKRTKHLDVLSATLILQSYLDRGGV